MQRIVRPETIQQVVRRVRTQVVMLDSDLAALYHAPVKALNQAVARNRARFPTDFMFRLTRPEWDSLRSQSVTLEGRRGRHRKYPPYAFTEQGVAMLSSVLRSRRAIAVNVQIMRTFVRLRRTAISHQDLARKIEALERKYDGQFSVVFTALRELTQPAVPPRRTIGFLTVRRDSLAVRRDNKTR